MAGANVETVAKAMNITPRRVQQLVNEGMPKATRGEYDLGQCMAWYIRFLQTALEKRTTSEGMVEMAQLTRSRTRLATEQASRTAMLNAELRGDLGRISVWKEELARFLGTIRSALVALPTKLAPVTDGDIRQRRDRLEAGVNEILDKISNYRPTGGAVRDTAGNSGNGARTAAAAEAHGQRMGRRKPATQ
jgi:phage terminase Nu1 subunit (DNA packaging protein)